MLGRHREPSVGVVDALPDRGLSRLRLSVRRPPGMWLLSLPAVLFFLFFLIAPLGVVVYYSLQPSAVVPGAEGGLSLANYGYFLGRAFYVAVILRTLRFAFLSTVASAVIGYGAALVLRRVSERVGSTAVLILAFPILSGPIVTVMGWMVMLTSDGIVGRGLALFRSILGLPEASTRLLGTDTAVVISMIHFSLPFVILNVLNVLLRIDPTLEQAASSLGANRWQVFRHVVWPLSLPGVYSASLIAFALGMSAYVNPTYLGNPSRRVMTTQVANFVLTSYNWQLASATAVILLVISLVIMMMYGRFFSHSIRV